MTNSFDSFLVNQLVLSFVSCTSCGKGIEHWWINATEYVSYADNHIAVFSNGALGNTANHSHDGLLAATPSIPNLSDGQVRKLKYYVFSLHPSFVPF